MLATQTSTSDVTGTKASTTPLIHWALEGRPQGTIRRVEIREHVYSEGDPRTHVFEVEQGVVAVYKTLVDGRRRIVDFAYPGDLMGLGVFSEHVLSAQAVSPTRIRCLSASTLERAAAADPNLAIKLYRAACRELATTRELLVTIGQTKALERVATFLLALHRRSGASCDGVVALAMRRSDIADLLGLTIESVSRMLTKLRAMGVIDLKQGGTTVHIRNFEHLVALSKG